MKRLLPIAFLALLIAGCNTSGCLDNGSAIPLASLLSSATGQKVTINMVQVHGVGVPGDSILVTSGTAVSEIYLPMRSNATSVQWCFHYTQSDISGLELNDTISLGYTSQPYFASEECGAYYRYHIDKCETTTHLIDSVLVVDSLVTNVDKTYLQIYIRTAESDPNAPAQ